MLGDLIGEEQGKVTGYRVLPSEGGAKVEVTFRTNTKIVGANDNVSTKFWEWK